jgi:hypothetical protein
MAEPLAVVAEKRECSVCGEEIPPDEHWHECTVCGAVLCNFCAISGPRCLDCQDVEVVPWTISRASS